MASLTSVVFVVTPSTAYPSCLARSGAAAVELPPVLEQRLLPEDAQQQLERKWGRLPVIGGRKGHHIGERFGARIGHSGTSVSFRGRSRSARSTSPLVVKGKLRALHPETRKG